MGGACSRRLRSVRGKWWAPAVSARPARCNRPVCVRQPRLHTGRRDRRRAAMHRQHGHCCTGAIPLRRRNCFRHTRWVWRKHMRKDYARWSQTRPMRPRTAWANWPSRAMPSPPRCASCASWRPRAAPNITASIYLWPQDPTDPGVAGRTSKRVRKLSAILVGSSLQAASSCSGPALEVRWPRAALKLRAQVENLKFTGLTQNQGQL